MRHHVPAGRRGRGRRSARLRLSLDAVVPSVEPIRRAFTFADGSAEAEALVSGIPAGSGARLGDRPDGARLDVLVSHGPPHGILDRATDGHLCGSVSLWRRLFSGERPEQTGPAPRLVVCGHIHEAAGATRIGDGADGCLVVNASVIDARYQLARAPVVVELGAHGPAVVSAATT